MLRGMAMGSRSVRSVVRWLLQSVQADVDELRCYGLEQCFGSSNTKLPRYGCHCEQEGHSMSGRQDALSAFHLPSRTVIISESLSDRSTAPANGVCLNRLPGYTHRYSCLQGRHAASLALGEAWRSRTSLRHHLVIKPQSPHCCHVCYPRKP